MRILILKKLGFRCSTLSVSTVGFAMCRSSRSSLVARETSLLESGCLQLTAASKEGHGANDRGAQARLGEVGATLVGFAVPQRGRYPPFVTVDRI